MADALPEFSLDWPFAYGKPEFGGVFRATPEDFVVDEDLGFEPSGEGEHVMLHIRKRGDNTAWVAKLIAQLAGVKPMDVGYCGLKDRHAVTSQWFSVYLGKKPEADWQQLNSESVKLLQVARHHQKLRRGMHRANAFSITLRDMDCQPDELEPRLQQIKSQGVPNYFGDQRFGREAGNLPQAQALLTGETRIRDRQKRGLILSAARSYLFNLVLAQRLRDGSWLKPLEGEVCLEGKASAPLWGRGRSAAEAEALQAEQSALQAWQSWCDGLEHVGLSQERRALVLRPRDFSWCWQDQDLTLDFQLGTGDFATAVLRELAMLKALPSSADVI